MTERTKLLVRVEELLWAIAVSDVEGVSAHRWSLLERLGALERKAAKLEVPDVYSEVVAIALTTQARRDRSSLSD
jgi:hypothetical protein